MSSRDRLIDTSPRAKKVLFVASVESHLLNFHKPYMSLLRGKGYEVHAATRLGSRQHEFEALAVVTHNIDFSRTPYSPLVLKSLLQMLRLLKENRFDLVHVHTPVAAFITRLACQLTNTHPVLYTAHGFHFYKGAPLKNWLLYYPMEVLAARWTDGLVVMNDEDYELARGFRLRTNGKVFYVPGVGVDLDKYNFKPNSEVEEDLKKDLGLPSDCLILTCVAELIPRKNQAQLIEALSLIDNESVYLLLVGEGPMRKKLEKLAAQKKLSSRVLFLGYRADVPRILRVSDVVALTSRHEGLPRAIMEAMAAGKPVIATDVRGNRDLVKHGETGFLVKLGDATQTAKALINLLENPQTRNEFGLEGRERVRSFSTTQVVPLMEEIYDWYLEQSLR